MVIFIGVISVIIFALYFRDLKKNPITTKKMIVIAMMSGLSFMLGLIQFVKYPQRWRNSTIFYVTNNGSFIIIW